MCCTVKTSSSFAVRLLESPGPATTASAQARSCSRASSGSGSSSFQKSAIASGRAQKSGVRFLSSVTTFTMPAPDARTALAHKTAAPHMAPEPASTSTFPKVPLFPIGVRVRNRSRSSFSTEPYQGVSSSPASKPIPISRTRTSPAYRFPGSKRSPGFAQANVTVALAFTAASRTSPVSVWIPEGMSTARTGTPLAQIASTALRYSPASERDTPIPKMASMITVYSRKSGFLTSRTP